LLLFNSSASCYNFHEHYNTKPYGAAGMTGMSPRIWPWKKVTTVPRELHKPAPQRGHFDFSCSIRKSWSGKKRHSFHNRYSHNSC